MTPVEHDTHLLVLMRDLATAEHRKAMAFSTLQACTDLRPRDEQYRQFTRIPDPRTTQQVLTDYYACLRGKRPWAGNYGMYGRTAQGYLDKFDAADNAVFEAGQRVRNHEAHYTGWQRYWLVTSSPGHVHRSRDCSSCKFTTTYALVPSLSDSTEAAAVEMFGPAMCSVCFPTAPTGLKVSKALAESVGTHQFTKLLAKHQAKNGVTS